MEWRSQDEEDIKLAYLKKDEDSAISIHSEIYFCMVQKHGP